jgi:ubiquinone/menaquinone biosynthesis C-methylase UbiE
MAHRVCPWWLGYVLASPLRRLICNPNEILAPHVRAGMTVIEPGPGMGFFTLPLARMVGPKGRVVAVDIEPKMLESLRRRAGRAGLAERIETRVARAESLGLDGWEERADFALAFAMVHELPSAASFFQEIARALKPGAGLLLAEPAGHIGQSEFDAELAAAGEAGLEEVGRPEIRRSLAVVLRKVSSAS